METKSSQKPSEAIIYQLQSLYAWVDFYRQNQQYSSLEKAKEQVKEFKEKHNLE